MLQPRTHKTQHLPNLSQKVHRGWHFALLDGRGRWLTRRLPASENLQHALLCLFKDSFELEINLTSSAPSNYLDKPKLTSFLMYRVTSLGHGKRQELIPNSKWFWVCLFKTNSVFKELVIWVDSPSGKLLPQDPPYNHLNSLDVSLVLWGGVWQDPLRVLLSRDPNTISRWVLSNCYLVERECLKGEQALSWYFVCKIGTDQLPPNVKSIHIRLHSPRLTCYDPPHWRFLPSNVPSGVTDSMLW